MNKHLIGQFGTGSGRYSIFKNPNEKLRKEISEYSPDIQIMKTGWPQTSWDIDTWGDDDVKCTSGKNVMYFPKKEVEEFIKDERERLRNKKYPAYKYFKDCFGIISMVGTGDYAYLKKIDLIDAISIGAICGITQDIDTMRVEGYENFIEYSICTYYGLSFKSKISGNMMCLYFNKNGDFINRDYNENLQKYTCDNISNEEILSIYRERLMEIPNELEYYRGKYYSDKICYVPCWKERNNEVYLYHAHVKNNGTYQVSSGWSIYKKPKSTIKKTREDLINELRTLFKEHLKLDL